MHQTGVAYKQLPPNIKTMPKKQDIAWLPPVDHVPVMSAITAPEPGTTLVLPRPSDALPRKNNEDQYHAVLPFPVQGYALSGAGNAIIRVDVSCDGGKTWSQAD